MSLITHDIIRRYALVRGVDADDLRREQNLNPDAGEFADRVWILFIDYGLDDMTEFEYHERLTLCGVAEQLDQFAKCRDTGGSVYQQGIADASVFQAEQMLKAADVDPEEWARTK